MGKAYTELLDANFIYGCKNCKTHLTSYDQLISKSFSSRNGNAFLFDGVLLKKSKPTRGLGGGQGAEDRTAYYMSHILC